MPAPESPEYLTDSKKTLFQFSQKIEMFCIRVAAGSYCRPNCTGVVAQMGRTGGRYSG